MSYGTTPYDKKSYRESKRRRKQALREEKTGRILPFSTVRRRIIAVVCAVSAIICAAVAGCFVYGYFVDKSNKQAEQLTELEKSGELLTIVNRQNTLTTDYVPPLSDYKNIKVNTLALDSLKQFVSDAENSGITLKLTTGYISFDEQNELYGKTLSQFLENPDYTEVRAQAAAQKFVPPAGCSEAQTGLLLGFDMSDEKTAAYVERKCVDFGFIQRYPKDKEEITKMSENKTLYRYVGADNAVKMRSFNMCLEEYADYVALQNNRE